MKKSCQTLRKVWLLVKKQDKKKKVIKLLIGVRNTLFVRMLKKAGKELEQQEIFIIGSGLKAIVTYFYICVYKGNLLKGYIIEDRKKKTYFGKPIYQLENVFCEDQSQTKFLNVKKGTAISTSNYMLQYGISLEQIYILGGWLEEIGAWKMDCYDVNLGYTRYMDELGFAIYGERNAEILIVTLGGSTTDATFGNLMSWSEILYQKLRNAGISVCIYCGGMCTYTSSQELVKLIRDVVPLKPDIVISLSGYNNISETDQRLAEGETPFTRKYQADLVKGAIKKKIKNTAQLGVYIDKIGCGLKNSKSIASYWVDDMRMMHAICKEFGILFYGFLQPSIWTGNYIQNSKMDMEELIMVGADDLLSNREIYWNYRENQQQIQNLIHNIDYIEDLSNLFDGDENIFMDSIHVFEKGNKKIGNQIYRVIIKKVKELTR